MAITVLITVGFLAMVAFVALYAVGSPDWRRSPMGRNLMALPAVLGSLLGLWLLARVLGPLPLWLWASGIAALDAVMWWRVVILWRIQRKGP
jgi:uncharacterized membrane protein